MAAVGRLLYIFGWLWFIAGLLAPILDVFNINFFPGLILIFIGRLLRSQAKRREPEEEPEPAAVEPPARPLNTDRTQPGPVPKPAPRQVEPPRGPVTPTPPVPVATEAPQETEEDEERAKLFSKVILAASAHAEEEAEEGSEVSVEEVRDKPLTSQEMIARARRRWDRRG